jgi:glycosyltransferase involved in cell wall biosynthesis
MSKLKIAAIIPAYNEEKTIADVVRAAKASEFLSEVIVVSDGSTDKTADKARRVGATVYVLKPNRGKGGAMAYGVEQTKAEIILFLDADLKGLHASHIKRLLMPVIRGEKTMTVGIRDRGKWLSKLGPHLPLIGGERAMNRFVFERIPKKYLKGFMVESALNYYCRSRRLPYGTVFLPGLNMRKKMQKVGVVRGLGQYAKMTWQVAKSMVIVRWGKKRGRF